CVLLLLVSRSFYFFYFFFQAEDGIRDATVTGVQTCALPISERARGSCSRTEIAGSRAGSWVRRSADTLRPNERLPTRWRDSGPRSEERRVGKERRSRW